MASNARIAIIGLGFIGTSLGLALKRDKVEFEIVGHDRDNGTAGQARKLGAVDKTEWNLINACEPADLIILALPVRAIRDTFEAIAPYVKKGVVITDTANIKAPVLSWAEELLPAHVHFVGADPIIHSHKGLYGSATDAHADLFQEGVYCLCPSYRAAPDAVRVVSDLAQRVGAQALFLDAEEHDGLMAAVEHLPAVLAGALLTGTATTPLWREMRKLAGAQYALTTGLASEGPEVLSDAVLMNRTNLLRWIDAFQEALQEWRELVAEADEEAVQERVEEALHARLKWMAQRERGDWNERETEMPSRSSMWQPFLGGLMRRRN